MDLNDLITRIANYLPHLFAALPVALIIVLVATLTNMALARAVVLLARRTHLNDGDLLPIRYVIQWIVRIMAFVVIMSVFGFQIGGIWTVLSTVLGLVAIGFVAMWSLISHTTATMIILVLRPFQIGDDIELAGEPVKGRVIDLNFFFTTLIDHDGMLQQVPNNLFFQKTLKRRKNFSPIRLATQLNSREPAAVELPPKPALPEEAGTVKKEDATKTLTDAPASSAPAADKPAR